MNTGRTILVVEDDENDLKLTLAALNGHNPGLNVVIAQDGGEALDFLRCHGRFSSRQPGNPDMVLLDLRMPRMDGLEALGAIKADAALQTIPVVVFTSSSRDSDVVRSYRLGASAYVVKPMDYSRYSDVIQSIYSFWLSHNLHPPIDG